MNIMSNKIAVIKTGGKQYKVSVGKALKVEKIEGDEGKKIKFETLLISSTDAKEIEIGQPTLGEKVEAKILEQGKSDKVMVVKFKNKTRYLRTKGHRQPFTKVEIVKIG
jgi:large subunit ribosomal protein L21